MKPAIRVDGLSKRYHLPSRQKPRNNNLTESLQSAVLRCWNRIRADRSRGSSQADWFWAVKDVSFEVNPGEVIGIIGRNGAGKSTLLKMLSRIVRPTEGRAEIRGRMGSLLEVGTGFHPELTGRENIYLNGSVLGMAKREIDAKFDAIVAFSEIESFLDMPVKRYSSGMYVRLAFSVAAHLEPDILVVDEVLAVGDQGFQAKCTGKMRSVGGEGRTVLFVSHNLAAVQNLCTRCIFIDQGRVEMEGSPEEVISRYLQHTSSGEGFTASLAGHRGRTPGSIEAMKRVQVLDGRGAPSQGLCVFDDLVIRVDFELERALPELAFGLIVKNKYGAALFGMNNQVIPWDPLAGPIQKGAIDCRFRSVPLMPGQYLIDLYFGTRSDNFDVVENAVEFTIEPKDVFGSGRLPPPISGDIVLPAEWKVTYHESFARGGRQQPDGIPD